MMTATPPASAKGFHYQGLSHNQISLFKSRIAKAPKAERYMLNRVAGYVWVMPNRSGMGGGAYTATNISADKRGRIHLSFEVHLAGWILNPHSHNLAKAYHLQMHELGHVLINSFADADSYAAFSTAFASSSAWQECFADHSPHVPKGKCVDPDEIFADQWAFWATGNNRVRSNYRVPPLLSHQVFGKIIAATHLAHAGLFASWTS